MTDTEQDQDVVDLLLAQHEQVKELFQQLTTARGEAKRALFHDLVRMLAVHESAEEQIVHPAARKTAGDAVVDARLKEEDEAKRVLAHLAEMDTDDPTFDSALAAFAAAVLDHAEHEEHEEFVTLRAEHDPARLRRMAGAVRAAEAVAPTRPHPSGGESATANLVTGPPLALFDRARDAVRDWHDKNRD